MTKRRLSILLSGMIAGYPCLGGATWSVLQYWLGLRRLGHEVFFAEPLRKEQIQPAGATLSTSRNAVYFRAVCREFGLEENALLFVRENGETFGTDRQSLRSAARRADVLINIAGMLPLDEQTQRIPIRVYLDLDPAFTQLWHEAEQIDMRFDGHSHFLTVGLAIGAEDCLVPTCGLSWLKTLQPLVFAHWPRAERLSYDALTTVGNWRAYGSITSQGVFFGQKAHSLRPHLAAARRSAKPFRLALSIHDEERKDLTALAEHGWQLLDPAQVADTPARYREFVQTSWAEFGLAKSGYVASRCGWFSDRSVCYLASGRPVLAQQTGFTSFLPAGRGLLSFETTEDILTGVEALCSDYNAHCRAARAMAEEFFDSDKVLSQLLERVGAVS
jgi:hypothetical protein